MNSALPVLAPEKDKIAHSNRGSLGFSIFLHSALTKKGLKNDKIAHSYQGQWRPFRIGFIVINGGDRGVFVITPLFYYFYSRASGACHGRASSVPR